MQALVRAVQVEEIWMYFTDLPFRMDPILHVLLKYCRSRLLQVLNKVHSRSSRLNDSLLGASQGYGPFLHLECHGRALRL